MLSDDDTVFYIEMKKEKSADLIVDQKKGTCCSVFPFSSSLLTSFSLPRKSSRRSLYSLSVLSISLSKSDASFFILLASS